MRKYFTSTFQALGSRDYRLFACGQVISVSGSWMQKLAQAWLVLVLTDSGFMLGLTAALQHLPTLLLTTRGGALADRFDRRLILVFTNISGMLPAIFLGVMAWLDAVQWWMVVVAATFQGVVDAIDKPARMTLVNDIVGPGMLTNAVTLNHVIQQCGKLVGPAVGGVLIGTVGVSAAFFANAASFVPVVIGLLMIRALHMEQRVGVGRSGLIDSLRYVAARRDLTVALGLAAVVGLFCFNFQVLIPILFRDVLGGGAAEVGWALTCMGLGGVLGGLCLVGAIRGDARTQVLSASVLGISVILLAVAPTPALGYVAGFTVGAASVAFAAASGAHIQLCTDRDMRGRIMALYVLAFGGSSIMGGPLQGGLAELTSARVSFAVASLATLGGCAVAWRMGTLRLRAGRGVIVEPALEPAPH